MNKVAIRKVIELPKHIKLGWWFLKVKYTPAYYNAELFTGVKGFKAPSTGAYVIKICP